MVESENMTRTATESRWALSPWLIIAILTIGTVFSVILLYGSINNKDPEGQVIGAALGGAGIAFFTPFWCIFRRNASLWLILPFLVIVLLGVLEFNAWIGYQAGEQNIHFYNCWPLLLFSLPGIGVLIGLTSRNKPESPIVQLLDENVWPPPPTPPSA